MKTIIICENFACDKAIIIDRPAVSYMKDVLEKVGAEHIMVSTGGTIECGAFAEPDETILLFDGIMPFITESALKNIIAAHKDKNKACTYIKGVFAVTAKALKDAAESGQGGIFNKLAECATEAVAEQDAEQFLSVKCAASLARAINKARHQINEKHMKNGVIIIDPSQTYIGANVCCGKNTVIYPQTYLEGETSIGENCVIGPGAKIVGSTIKDGVTAEFSVILKSTIGSHTNVGPFAFVRPDSTIGEHCKIGDFVEVKNSTIGDYTKASHLTYVGDSDVGERVNFGCGTVTVNYDGANKARTTIENNAFIGCNTNLIAPVTVGENAYTAAGSTITKDVPANSLAVARARQENNLKWKRKTKIQ